MTASEHIKTDLDRDPEWWAGWFKQDFSWEGLKKRPWQGWVVVDEARCMPAEDAPEGATVRDATLQDYWRADPVVDWVFRELGEPGEADSQAELVRLEGTVWHRAHLPPSTLEGARSWKADPDDKSYHKYWEQLQADLQARLAQGFESKFDRLGKPEDADGRAQLDGAIINTLSLPHKNKESPVHLSMVCAAHLLGVNAQNTYFGGLADFNRASFGGLADFNRASFGGLADFNRASFGGDASFNSASFGGYASFNSASFGGYAWFNSASFGGYAWFNSASFGWDAWFNSASFGEYASFSSASFGGDARFESASFGEYAWFNSASFGRDARLNRASFGGYADFNSASFGGDARFNSALCLKGASFQRGAAPAQTVGRLVQGATGKNTAKALSSAPKDTDYTLVLSHGAAKRETGAFQGFSFSDGLSLGALDFSDRVFSKAPIFENVQFFGAPRFYRAELHDGVSLLGAEFRYDEGAPAISWDELVEHLKERTGFKSENDQTALPSQTALKTAWLNHLKREKVQYTGEKSKGLEPEQTNPFWRAALIAWRTYALRLPHTDRLKDPTGMNWSDSSRKERLAAAAEDAPYFEQAYRRLKLLMGGMGAHIEEQRFFACELRARQARRPETDPDIKFGEPSVAALYGLIADYGRSFIRPLWGLLAVWMLTSVLYAGLLQGVHEPQANSISLTRPPGLNEPYEVPSSSNRLKEHLDSERQRWRAKAYVFHQIVGPMVFAAEITLAPVANPIRHHPWAMALNEAGPVWAAAFSLLRLIHRILAIPLLFLFALALRRRFQLG